MSAEATPAAERPVELVSVPLVGSVLRRPTLWRPAAAALVRHVPTGWWRGGARRRAEPWMRFRLETAYGAERTSPTEADLVTWLQWLRAWVRLRGR